MDIVVHWYDLVCFGIVGIAFFGAILLMWWRGQKIRSSHSSSSSSVFENLLLMRSRPEDQSTNDLFSLQLWNSCWQGLHPGWLLSIRFLSFAILCGFLIWDVLKSNASVFIYYTEWTFTLAIMYFAIATIVSAHGCVLHYTQSKLNKAPTENGRWESNYGQPERAGFWGYLMQISFQTCAGAVVLTDIVFWFVIVPFLPNVHLQLNLLMGCMHTLNAVFLLLDTSINSLSFPWFRLAYFVLWSCCYVIFQWVIHACGFTWWPYPFLELTPWAPLWYVCIAVVHVPCYGFYWLVVRAKYYILPRLFPDVFVKY